MSTTSTPLIVGAAQKAALAGLRQRAAENPVDIVMVMEQIKTHDGKAAHRTRMTDLSILIPLAFVVTFSIETRHPCGTCRHMSMSSDRKGRVPTPAAVWMICEELGFIGGLEACTVFTEDLQRLPNGKKQMAVNVVQPIAIVAPSQSANARGAS